MKYKIILWVYYSCFVFLYSCNFSTNLIKENDSELLDNVKRFKDYKLLPEKVFSISDDKETIAFYSGPTDRYQHGILGDKIEASKLVVSSSGKIYELDLLEKYVFEDINPRMFDIDNDGDLEFITIRSDKEKGAGIVIYKIVNDNLEKYAYVPEIGIRNRWLNIVSINNLDKDEIKEIVWIETPHIGGKLKVAKINKGEINAIDQTEFYSNHSIGEKNLCLSVLGLIDNQKVFYVPNQSRDKIVGFSLVNNKLVKKIEIDQKVDFSVSLIDQYDFDNIIESQSNCISSKN